MVRQLDQELLLFRKENDEFRVTMPATCHIYIAIQQFKLIVLYQMEKDFFSFLRDLFQANADYNSRVGKLCDGYIKSMGTADTDTKKASNDKPKIRKTKGY